MNILLCFPFSDGETGIAIKEAFEHHSCRVCSVDAQTQARELFSICDQYRGDFDILLCSRTHALYEEIVRIKKVYPKIKTAIWNTDVREPISFWGPITYLFEYVDFYFHVSEGQNEEWLDAGINAHFLPQGLHSRRYFRMLPTESMKTQWGCDIGFIGNLNNPNIHKERIETCNALNASRYKFRQFEGIIGETHNYVVSCSKINLCNSATEIKDSYSVRNWKILGAGGVAIEKKREGLEEFFNGYIEGYESPQDAVSVSRHILNNYEDYAKRAIEASKWAHENHTYKNRIETMMEIVNGS